MTQPLAIFPASSAQPKFSTELALTLLGPSTAMAQLWSQMRRLAPHVRTVLLTGESDCGQEAVARVLLDLSPHPHRNFIAITAADAEDRLLRPSALHLLSVDTFLFLPDLQRFSPAAQEGLLRLLRTRRSRPLTVVACVNEDPRSLVSLAGLSPELAELFGTVRIAVPSLRQRPEDLPMLITHMLSVRAGETAGTMPGLTEDFLRAAMAHPWSGNLAELARTVKALVSGPRVPAELRAADLHRVLAGINSRPVESSPSARMVSLDTVVQEHILAVLRACHGNKLRAAEVLGISRSTLYRMLDSAAGSTPLSIAS